jgi:hypothetical protein
MVVKLPRNRGITKFQYVEWSKNHGTSTVYSGLYEPPNARPFEYNASSGSYVQGKANVYILA